MTLLGSGGAASSICVQAALDGAREIDVLSIKDNFWSKAEKLVSDINDNTDCKVNLIEMNDDSIGESVFSSDILTNATPIGMAPNTDGCLVKDSSILRPELIVSDIIYNPLETKLYKMAKEKCCSVFNGYICYSTKVQKHSFLDRQWKCLLKKSKQSTLISAIKTY